MLLNIKNVFPKQSGPNSVVSSTLDEPTLKAILSNVYIWKRCPCGSNQSWLYMIIDNPYWTIECAKYPSFLKFSSVFRSKWVLRRVFPSALTQIYILNPKSRHLVTLATPRIAEVSRAKVFIRMKLSRLPGLSYLPRQDNIPTRVFSSPETGSWSSCKRLVEFCKEISETLPHLG